MAQLVLRGAAQELGVYRSAAQVVARRVAERRAAEEAAAAAARRAAEEAAAAVRAEAERQAALEAAAQAARVRSRGPGPRSRSATDHPLDPHAGARPPAGVTGERTRTGRGPLPEPGQRGASQSGLGALSMDGRLQASAQGWARQLAQDASLHHQDVGQFLDGWTTAGENIAFGPSVDTMFAALVASPRHYANMVRREFSAVGIGVVVGPDGQLWTSHVFAG